MTIRCLLFVCGLALASFSTAQDDDQQALLHALGERLVFHDGVSGNFKQSKYLSFMSQPLRSQGVFSLDEDQGLLWQVQQPVSSIMTVQGRKVMLDGVAVNDAGVGRLMAGIMNGLLNGDLDKLSNDFDLAGELDKELWQLQLKPKSPLVATVLAQVVIHGDSVLHSIDVQEKNNNRTLIEFSDVRPLEVAQPLTADDG